MSNVFNTRHAFPNGRAPKTRPLNRPFAHRQDARDRSRRPEVQRLDRRDHIACIWASRGFFQALGVGDWATLEPVLLGTIREPGRIREKAELYGEFCARML